MTTMDGDDMQRLWSLIEDLTNQLQANRQLCESLQQQADQLRGQAIHSGTGFALRRFNTDLSKEKFESELEALNAHLVKENLALSQENKQQAMLLREYENTLETVMAKFRSFSHSTQQHTLQLTQHYESLLAQTTHNAAEQTLAAETAFSGTLTHLGGLVRRAMQSLDGEVSDDESDDQDRDSALPPKPKRGWAQDPKWYGSGGYTGSTTDPIALRAEEALDRLTEEERLRMENDTLRELLGLKEKSDALISSADAIQPYVIETPAPKPMSPAERRASLTVDEAAIAAEASGQPPNKALQISSTTRPGEESEPKPVSPSRVSPKLIPALDRKDQIIEEAILADDESHLDRGRRASDPSLSIGSPRSASDDAATASSPTASLPAVFAADDAETAPSSIEELRAAAKQTAEAGELHATLPVQAEGGAGASTDADAITPIDEVDQVTTTESAAGAEPNLLAEAAPPALVSTGIEEGGAIASKTTVTSASGIDVTEASSASSTVSPPTQPVSSSTDADAVTATASLTDTGSSAQSEAKEDAPSLAAEPAPPADGAEGDFQPIAATATSPDDAPQTKESVIPAEPAKQDNESVTPEAVAEAQTLADTAPPAAEEKSKADTTAEGDKASKDAQTLLKPPAGATGQGNQGRKDGSPSPAKKGGRGNRGRRHNKSSSNASNKSSS